METQRPLMVAGLISFILFLVSAGLMLIDQTEILGINRWIKPMKFFISIAIFLWTMAIYFDYLPGRTRLLGYLAWAIILIFVIEMVVIAGQPLRGQTSHFNIATPLDAALFAAMGIAIALLTFIMAFVAYLYFTNEIDLPPAVVWGMRLGLIVMLLGSIQGGYMSAQFGHAVGVPEGGAGLPLVNWSTKGGDLRVAHFLGLHGLQTIPLFALLLGRLNVDGSVALTVGFSLIYTLAFSALFAQALFGRPLVAV
jgi:hypothetical protein